MTLAVVAVALFLASCSPGAQVARSENAPSPVKDGGKGGNVLAQPKEPRLLMLGHKWARGQFTIVEVRRKGDAYELESRRLVCSSGTSRLIGEGNERAELERALAVLDPRIVSEDDPCARSVRDGTAWVVEAEVDGVAVTRGRQFGVSTPQECADFQGAAEVLMLLAGLRCSATTCLRQEAGPRDVTACP